MIQVNNVPNPLRNGLIRQQQAPLPPDELLKKDDVKVIDLNSLAKQPTYQIEIKVVPSEEPKTKAPTEEDCYAVVQQWAAQQGLNPHRLADVVCDPQKIKMDKAVLDKCSGAYFKASNKIFYKNGDINIIIPHEAFHSYASNLRTALYCQEPMLFNTMIKNNVLDDVKNLASTRVMVTDVSKELPPSVTEPLKSLAFDYYFMQDELESEEESDKLADLFINFTLNLDEYVEGNWDGSRKINDHGKEVIQSTFPDQPEKIEQIILNHTDEMIDKQITLQSSEADVYYVEAPLLHDDERSILATYLETLLDDYPHHLCYEEIALPHLNDATKEDISKNLIPQLKEYSQAFWDPKSNKINEKAEKKVIDYLEAQVNRYNSIRYFSTVPSYLPNDSAHDPLTPKERKLAIDALKGAPSTIEGNEERLFSYRDENTKNYDYTFCWEELRARKASLQFIRQLAENPTEEMDPDTLSTYNKAFKKEYAIMQRGEKSVNLLNILSKNPKDPAKIDQVNSMIAEIYANEDSLDDLKTQIIASNDQTEKLTLSRTSHKLLHETNLLKGFNEVYSHPTNLVYDSSDNITIKKDLINTYEALNNNGFDRFNLAAYPLPQFRMFSGWLIDGFRRIGTPMVQEQKDFVIRQETGRQEWLQWLQEEKEAQQ